VDSLTQFALGAGIAHGLLGRDMGRRGLILGGVLATLPDLDVLVGFGDPIEDFVYHRSATHSLIVLTLASPLLAWPLYRLLAPPGMSFGRVLLATGLILGTHALLDALTIYGTQLLWPLRDHPFGTGSIFIIDPVYTGLLLLGLIVAVARGARSKGAQRATAVALLLSTVYLGAGLLFQALVTDDVRDRLARGEGGAPPPAHETGTPPAEHETGALPARRLLVHATPFNILAWRVLVMDRDGYRVGYRSLLAPDRPLRLERFGDRTELPAALTRSDLTRRLLAFTKGFYQVGRTADGGWTITDLRMGVEPSRFVFSFAVAGRDDMPLDVSRRQRVQRFSTGDLSRLLSMIRIGTPLAVPATGVRGEVLSLPRAR
jgi:inner membrane protein